MAMVVAGKLGLYSILRFILGLFPVQARMIRSLDDHAGRDRHPLRRVHRAGADDLKRLIAYAMLSALSF